MKRIEHPCSAGFPACGFRGLSGPRFLSSRNHTELECTVNPQTGMSALRIQPIRTRCASQRRAPERGSATRSSFATASGQQFAGRMPFTLFLIFLAVKLLFLSGCAVGPNYKPPQTSVAASFANAPTNVASTDEATLATGWKGFNDARLDGLADRAIAHTHDLRIDTA